MTQIQPEMKCTHGCSRDHERSQACRARWPPDASRRRRHIASDCEGLGLKRPSHSVTLPRTAVGRMAPRAVYHPCRSVSANPVAAPGSSRPVSGSPAPLPHATSADARPRRARRTRSATGIAAVALACGVAANTKVPVAAAAARRCETCENQQPCRRSKPLPDTERLRPRSAPRGRAGGQSAQAIPVTFCLYRVAAMRAPTYRVVSR